MSIGIHIPRLALADGGSGSEPPDPPIGTVTGGDGNEPERSIVSAERQDSSQTDKYFQNDGLSLSDGVYALAGALLAFVLYRLLYQTVGKD